MIWFLSIMLQLFEFWSLILKNQLDYIKYKKIFYMLINITKSNINSLHIQGNLLNFR
jgi:hypothetical protein